MNFTKKALLLLSLSTATFGSLTNLYASETTANSGSNLSFMIAATDATTATTPAAVNLDTTKPTIRTYTNVRDSKTYLMIDASDASGIAEVKVNDSTSGVTKYNNVYSYEVTRSQTYTIKVYDTKGNWETTSASVTISDKKPSLTLSKTYTDNVCYLVIKASDDGSIRKVTVNDDSISFSSNGDTVKYKITKSDDYKVVVTDNDGNTTTETLSISIKNDEPSLSLSQVVKDGKSYLVIKASPKNKHKISKVTVDNKKISFNASGDEVNYEVSSSGTYNVVVIDDAGLETSSSLYIQVNDKISPIISLSQTYINNSWYIIISVTDNDKVSSLTVNGSPVSIGTSGGTVRYQAMTSGNYTVIAKDNDGNETSKSIYLQAPVAPVTPVQKQTVVFKVNNKTWHKNGVAQSTMDAPPKSKNGRIYLPLRYIAYSLNIDSSNITWNPKSRTAIIKDGSNVIKITQGSKIMVVNNNKITMDAAAYQDNGRIMLPISQVSKAFSSKGIVMNWSNSEKAVTITTTH